MIPSFTLLFAYHNSTTTDVTAASKSVCKSRLSWELYTRQVFRRYLTDLHAGRWCMLEWALVMTVGKGLQQSQMSHDLQELNKIVS